ncbi:hypothetical protein J2805_001760 [Arthrobacter oryzae]|nr:hypothetical protein [Arthrobacter oryzae]
MAACRDGDTFVVTKLDRLARSVRDAHEIVDELAQRNVKLSIGGSVHDPTDPIGKLLFNVLAMVAEFESDLIRARTREGMKIAKAKGRLRARNRSCLPRRRPTWSNCTTPASTPLANSQNSFPSQDLRYTGQCSAHGTSRACTVEVCRPWPPAGRQQQRPLRTIRFGGAVVGTGRTGWAPEPYPKPLERADVLCLRALGALGHIEFDLLVLIQ